jgi:hypothetical protein
MVSPVHGDYRRCQAETPLIVLFRFPGPALFNESPALELVDLRVDGEAVLMTYRTSSGLVEALLDITEDGLITCCACGPA